MENLDKKNRELDAARVKNKDVVACETRQQVNYAYCSLFLFNFQHLNFHVRKLYFRYFSFAKIRRKFLISWENSVDLIWGLKVAAETFDKLSSLGKEELRQFSSRRVDAFAKNLAELADFQVAHSNKKIANLEQLIKQMEDVDGEL